MVLEELSLIRSPSEVYQDDLDRLTAFSLQSDSESLEALAAAVIRINALCIYPNATGLCNHEEEGI